MKKTKLLLYSRLALYPMHWEAFKVICATHDVEASVITTDYNDLPELHSMIASVDVEKDRQGGFSPKIYYIPRTFVLKKVILIFRYLRKVRPDIVWAQEEPVAPYIIPLLIAYYFNKKKPRIVVALLENIFGLKGIKKLFYNILWKRLDGILSVASISTKAVHKVGMPMTIPVYELISGCLSPELDIKPALIPIRKNKEDFIVGFVGRIVEEKGWKVVMKAIKEAPLNFKLVIAGKGNQIDQLKSAIADPRLTDRVYYAGLLPKKELWQLYKGLDCLVVPSLTTKTWMEQFGGVLADAMAVGLPIVGSDSGGIPEVVGPAGLIVRENDPVVLLVALEKLQSDPALRKKLGENGRKRFDEEFCITAYARKIAHGLGLD